MVGAKSPAAWGGLASWGEAGTPPMDGRRLTGLGVAGAGIPKAPSPTPAFPEAGMMAGGGGASCADLREGTARGTADRAGGRGAITPVDRGGKVACHLEGITLIGEACDRTAELRAFDRCDRRGKQRSEIAFADDRCAED